MEIETIQYRIRLRLKVEIFESGKKKLRIQIYSDKCRQGLKNQ